MGFHDFMIGGASVILVIVAIGVSSITLCCCSFSACLTLCSFSFVSVGFNILVMFDWRFLIHARPCGVLAVIFDSSASSSVKARRFLLLSGSGVGNAVGILLSNLRFCMHVSLGRNTVHIGSGHGMARPSNVAISIYHCFASKWC